MTYIADAFKGPSYGDRQTWHISSDDRIHAVRGFTREQCLDALTTEGLQKTVEQAIRRRLRQLERDAATQQVAWCWGSGLIEIGDAMPPDSPDLGCAIEIARGPRTALLAQLNVLARHGKGASRGQLLVPGVPEARTTRDAFDALMSWVLWCGAHDSVDGVVWAGAA